MRFDKLYKIAKKEKRIGVSTVGGITAIYNHSAIYIIPDAPEFRTADELLTTWGVSEDDRDGWEVVFGEELGDIPTLYDELQGFVIRPIATFSFGSDCFRLFGRPNNEQLGLNETGGSEPNIGLWMVSPGLLAPLDLAYDCRLCNVRGGYAIAVPSSSGAVAAYIKPIYADSRYTDSLSDMIIELCESREYCDRNVGRCNTFFDGLL